MVAIAVIITLVFITLGISVPIIVWRIQNNMREKKNYERALKMVPLLIHLPPMSEDIEGSGRDVRDIVDENISKAQIIYNIIASTIQKGFKSRLYGQRHFAFEIVGQQGFVYFYAMVPVALVNIVKQAIISAYSSAQVEEVAEHNIFNKVGKLSGVAGGELVLKKEFAYPIATYQEVKRDAMQALLNALSALEKEDGASIQLLLRPADPKWRQEASTLAGNIRKGKKKKNFGQLAFDILRQLFMALSKPPEAGGKSEDKAELSSLEQAVVDSIDDKTRYQGYEALVRVVISSNIAQRSQAILANVVASFSLFDAPGKNGFKYEPAEDAGTLVRDYLLRLFPQQKQKMILNSVELATLFHFPDQRSIPTSQLRRQDSKQVDAPRNMPSEGLLLGYNIFRGMKKPIRLSLQDRQRHMYVVGQTGTGKSTFLENLALQDMLNGDGFAFIDPHGDTVERLLAMVPKERTEDVIYFSPADMSHPMGLNIFEYETANQQDVLIQEALNMLYKLYDPQRTGMMGPRYEHFFRNAALTVMADPEGGTFVDIPKLFRDPAYMRQKLKHVTDPTVREFWEKEVPMAQRSNEFGDLINWFISKFGAFLSNEMMRNIIGQTTSAFDLRDIMDNSKILLVNLSKGRLGPINMQLLGMMFVMKFQAAAMSRANIPESERKDFALYVDEFQNFSTDSFASILSEARKYHLNLIAANQYTTQLTEEIRDAVFGNVGTTIAFRIADRDAEVMRKYFQPAFDESDLIHTPNYNAVVRTMIHGVPTQPFSMATLPPLGNPNPKLADALKQLSAAKYGRPKKEVEEEIFKRMETKIEPPKPGTSTTSFGSSPWSSPPPSFGSFGSATAAPSPYQARPMAAPKTGSSFLDEWLAKRQTTAPAGAFGAKPAVPAMQNIPQNSINSAPALATPSTALPNDAQKALGNQEKSPETKKTHLASPQSESKEPVVDSLIEPGTDLKQEQAKENEPQEIYIDREGEIHQEEEEHDQIESGKP